MRRMKNIRVGSTQSKIWGVFFLLGTFAVRARVLSLNLYIPILGQLYKYLILAVLLRGMRPIQQCTYHTKNFVLAAALSP